jgi:undecaprenyl-diphosphatase
MTILQALALGVVEGITEFLPVSSTGHLILTSKLFGIASTEAVKSFEIVIQSGAIAAVLVFYWKTLLKHRALWRPIIAAFIPTMILGFLLHDVVKTYLLGNVSIVLWSMGIGGIVLIAFEMLHKRQWTTNDPATIKTLPAALIGVMQTLAVIPGVSRSAATIVGGMLLGVSRSAIVEFSFLLALPTMAGATALDLLKSYDQFSSSDIISIVVGFVAAFVTAYIAITWLLKYVRTHTFIAFGVYRIAAALVLALIL